MIVFSFIYDLDSSLIDSTIHHVFFAPHHALYAPRQRHLCTCLKLVWSGFLGQSLSRAGAGQISDQSVTMDCTQSQPGPYPSCIWSRGAHMAELPHILPWTIVLPSVPPLHRSKDRRAAMFGQLNSYISANPQARASWRWSSFGTSWIRYLFYRSELRVVVSVFGIRC